MRDSGRPLRVFFASFVVIYIVICSLSILQVDFWWQVTEGLRMLRDFRLPTAPAAAFGLSARPYFDEYAGYEIVLALVYQAAGFLGLWFVFAAVYLLVVFLPTRAFGRRLPKFDFLSTASILVAAVLLKFRLEQRPELVGALFLVLLFFLLGRSRLEAMPARAYAYLFLIFAGWSNTHSTFVIGLGALFLWMGCELILKAKREPLSVLVRTGVLLAGAALLGTLANPYGAERLLFPFRQLSDPGGTVLSVEMWPIPDFHSPIGLLVLAAAGLLLLAFLISRAVPVWLMLFSIFSVYLAVKHIRFGNLLAVALLFVNAARESQETARAIERPRLLVLASNVFFALLCPVMLLWDSFGLTTLYSELRQQTVPATSEDYFAPVVVRTARAGAGPFMPVLCGHGEGAFLSFEANAPLHPLLDSGLAHFSNSTKRYFFFVWNEPDAFQIALADLHVREIIVDFDTFPWILSLRDAPQWQFVACSSNGQLWKRVEPGTATAPGPAAIREIESARDRLIATGYYRDAFCYSTLLSRPVDSLRLLAHYRGIDWSDALFNYFSVWVKSLPEPVIRTFLAGNHADDYPLVDAMLWARLGPGPYEAYLRTAPGSLANSWQWKVVEARVYLAANNREKAKQIFDSIAPRPISSIAYYQLWQELRPGLDAGADGRWQMWNESARQFILSTTTELNQRIDSLERAPAR